MLLGKCSYLHPRTGSQYVVLNHRQRSLESDDVALWHNWSYYQLSDDWESVPIHFQTVQKAHWLAQSGFWDWSGAAFHLLHQLDDSLRSLSAESIHFQVVLRFVLTFTALPPQFHLFLDYTLNLVLLPCFISQMVGRIFPFFTTITCSSQDDGTCCWWTGK